MRNRLVGGQHQLLAKSIQIQVCAGVEHQAVRHDVLDRRQPVEERRGLGEHNAARQPGQGVQTGETLRGDVRVRGNVVVGQAFPVRECLDRQIGAGCVETDLLFQSLKNLSVAADDQQRSRMAASRGDNGQSPAAAVQTAPGQGFAGAGRQKRVKRRIHRA